MPINIAFLTCLRNMAFLSSSSIFAMSARLLIRRRSISHTRKNRRRCTHKSWESVVQWLKLPLFMFLFSSQYGLSHGSSTGRGRTSSQTKSTVTPVWVLACILGLFDHRLPSSELALKMIWTIFGIGDVEEIGKRPITRMTMDLVTNPQLRTDASDDYDNWGNNETPPKSFVQFWCDHDDAILIFG